MKDFEKIDQLFVLPKAQRRDVARALWVKAKQKCTKVKTTINFWVRSSSIAVPVYERFGFSKINGLKMESGIVYQFMQLQFSPQS